ncbi:glycosyltransferase family 4 protein [Gramella lutea]|uniref:Glycosyltransferase family 4 protein n=1 Tax=Christiangramia lutea TaxID=1607951 RepID=A0A9X2A968_9FLAO|nr:glycosyltransferase [Christiangramia lutea]MCH4823075.1 glycosyltransferase family 4 protein [Christiangramia lutea]
MSRLLIIGYVWPEPASSAAGARMMQLIEFFLKQDYEITFATTARETDNMARLEEIGVKLARIRLNDPEFDVFLESLMPEMVLFDRFMMEEQFGWRVDDICPDALKILDTEDLHFLRNARQRAFKENKDPEYFYLDSELAKREIAAMYRCDLSLIISEVELQLLMSKFQIPGYILFYLPFMFNPISKEKRSELPNFDERKDFISIGNFLHEPNWNAVLNLKKKIWPKIRKVLPGVNLHIYGAYPSKKVLDLNKSLDGFMVHGWVKDSNKVMASSRICLAPILFGAGLKGKLVEAMYNGTPSVTTTIGAEGINNSEKWNGFIINETENFIDSAVRLYRDKEFWNTSQESGFEIFNERFNKEIHFQRFEKKINQVIENLQAQRNLNFTGKMLKHHLHKSTYFMSRFIEEKNRNKN